MTKVRQCRIRVSSSQLGRIETSSSEAGVSGTISEEALYYVGGCNTAKEIWSALEENQHQATKDREIQLKQQMQDMKLGSQTLSEYLKSFKRIFDGLATIQKSVADDDKVIYMSRGLGKNFNTLVTSMLAKLPFPSYSQFATVVQSYDLRMQGFHPESQPIDPNMDFYGNRPSGGGGKGRGTTRRRGSCSGFSSRGRGFVPASQPYTSHSNAFQQPTRPLVFFYNNQQQLLPASHTSNGQNPFSAITNLPAQSNVRPPLFR